MKAGLGKQGVIHISLANMEESYLLAGVVG
jgi:hypothetical protein